MRNHKGGDMVKTGFYLDWRNWRFEMIDAVKGSLSGAPETSYVRVPTLAMLVVAPILGALFVVFLPFIGFAIVGERAWAGVRSSVRKPEKPAVNHS